MIRKLSIILLGGVICLLGVTSALAVKYNEAPVLRVKVAAGELPPVEERLPEEPLVVQPYEQIGKYGGTLHLSMVSMRAQYPAAQINMAYVLMMDREFENVIPNVAKDWKISEDGKTFTLYLRKGHKWSDGAPFTADDILFWWEDVMLNKELTPGIPSQWTPGGEPMKLRKIDDYTIEYNFAKPYYSVAYNFASVGQRGRQGDVLLPKHALKKYHIKYNSDADKLAKEEGYDHWYQLFTQWADFSTGRQPVGIPSLNAWVAKKELPDGLIFERNPYYFKIDTAGNQLPYIDKIQAVSFHQTETHLLQMVTGQIDYEAWGTSMADFPVLQANAEKGGYRVWIGGDSWGAAPGLFFNQNYKEDPVLGDILRDDRFRHALSLAIDRDEVNDIVFLGKGVPRQATVHSSTSFVEEKWARWYANYDPERARQIRDEMERNEK